MLKPDGPFGKLYTLETWGEFNGVQLRVDGQPSGTRPWKPESISLQEITFGARYYTNGPGKQEVRGFAKCDIAEILLYNGSLSLDDRKKVRAYLDAKYAELKKALPPEPDGVGTLLTPIAEPPPVQVFVPGFTVKQLPLDLTNINNIKYSSCSSIYC